MNNKIYIVAVAVLILGLAGGYIYGKEVGYNTGYKKGDTAGYQKGQDDAQKLQEELARKAAEEAAKSANPFQIVNPLQDITANPFDDAKKALNPFAE